MSVLPKTAGFIDLAKGLEGSIGGLVVIWRFAGDVQQLVVF